MIINNYTELIQDDSQSNNMFLIWDIEYGWI